MSTTTKQPDRVAQREAQLQQAEELLGAMPQKIGVAKGMFEGRFVADWVFPYPQIPASQRPDVERAVAELERFCDEHLDPERIDREAEIPREVIDGLAHLGVLGMTAPTEFGGRGFSQMGYCRLLEVIGARCSSTAIFVNAHHSIGMRALLLFGTPEQKQKWLPDLVSGRKLAAFALTEPDAGSDAGNVQTSATPSPDGAGFILNGQKRYITNGGIAGMLTVMARTPVPGSDATADHRVSRHARYAGLRSRRAADGKARHPRHGDRATRLPRHVRPPREHPGSPGQGPESSTHRARLRPHHLRRLLHRRRENLPTTRLRLRPHTAPVRPSAGRV